MNKQCPNCQSNKDSVAITLNNTCPECGRTLDKNLRGIDKPMQSEKNLCKSKEIKKGEREKLIYRGTVDIDAKKTYSDEGPAYYVGYEIRKWKCYFCHKWITQVLVDGKVLLGGGTSYSVFGGKNMFCTRCWRVVMAVTHCYEK